MRPHKGKVYPGQHAAIVSTELWDEVSSTLDATKNSDEQRGPMCVVRSAV